MNTMVRAQDNNALRRVVPEQLQNIPSVLSTKTFLIFEDAGNRVTRVTSGGS
jgi:hypothetical protein